MATFHLELKPVQRSAKQSSVATAAYMSGKRLTDARENKTFDYTRKERVLEGMVFNPTGETLDRESFWNAVEAKHRRGDAVVARSFEIDLPKELQKKDLDAAKELAYAFGREVASHYGVGCEIDIHMGKNGLLHFHGMTSACRVNPDGTLGNKVEELDPIACKRAGTENAAEVLRPYWQDLCNEHLKAHGIDAHIDHRSYAARGLDIIPQIKEGWGPDADRRHEINVQIKITNEANRIARETAKELEAKRVEIERPAAVVTPVVQRPAARVEAARPVAPPVKAPSVEPPRQPAPSPAKKPQTIREYYAEALATGRQRLNALKQGGTLEAVAEFNKAVREVMQEAVKDIMPISEREYAEKAKAAQAKLADLAKKTAERNAFEKRAQQENPTRYTNPEENDPRGRYNEKRTIFNAKKWDMLCQQWDDLNERQEFNRVISNEKHKVEEECRIATGKGYIEQNAKLRANALLKELGYDALERDGKSLERALQIEYNKAHGIDPTRGTGRKGFGIGD